MALRGSWEGFLRLSLISVPVRAYNASVPGGGDIHFHQIHKDCGNRIRYQKVCPVHGEVFKEEIVSGYEYEKDRHVEIDPDEIAKLRADKDPSINIDVFIPPHAIDPVYFAGRTYYLAPSGPPGQKPYVLLQQVMKEKNRYALATMVISGKEEVVLLRPEGKLLTLTLLYYEHQVKNPKAFEDEVEETTLTPQEVKLASTLVEASTSDEVDFSKYKDQYTERINELLDAKLAGRKIEPTRGEREPAVINLMDALKKSLNKAQRAARRKPAAHRRKTG